MEGEYDAVIAAAAAAQHKSFAGAGVAGIAPLPVSPAAMRRP